MQPTFLKDFIRLSWGRRGGGEDDPISIGSGISSKRKMSRMLFCLVLWIYSLALGHGELIQVGVYTHSTNPVQAQSIVAVFTNILTTQKGFEVRKVTPFEIREGVLTNLQVLIMPGGSGKKQATNLETIGVDAIREFVRKGGGYVGFCAGSYLASCQYPYSLHIINSRVVDREHWNRGTGTVNLKFTEKGREILGHPETEVDVFYGQGPLFAPTNEVGLPSYTELATYGSEIVKNGASPGVMLNTTAISLAEFGEGRVVCFSPHPEKPFMPIHHLVLNAVRWTVGKDPIPMRQEDWAKRPMPSKPETLEPED
jgi:glutamine amidotransferase-like uncharacterized protein